MLELLREMIEKQGLKMSVIKIEDVRNNREGEFFGKYEIYAEWKHNFEKIGYGNTIEDAVVCAVHVFDSNIEGMEFEEGHYNDEGGMTESQTANWQYIA